MLRKTVVGKQHPNIGWDLSSSFITAADPSLTFRMTTYRTPSFRAEGERHIPDEESWENKSAFALLV